LLGSRIRQFRQHKNLTLNQLATMTDLTASYISQIERDIIDPSLSSLRKIATALETPLYVFLADEEEEQVLIKANERKKLELPNSSVKYEFLSPMTSDIKSDVKFVSLYFEHEKNTWLSEDFLVHDFQELIFILEGRLEIYLGDKQYVLDEGDSIFISENVPHKMFNCGDRTLKGIAISSPTKF